MLDPSKRKSEDQMIQLLVEDFSAILIQDLKPPVLEPLNPFWKVALALVEALAKRAYDLFYEENYSVSSSPTEGD